MGNIKSKKDILATLAIVVYAVGFWITLAYVMYRDWDSSITLWNYSSYTLFSVFKCFVWPLVWLGWV